MKYSNFRCLSIENTSWSLLFGSLAQFQVTTTTEVANKSAILPIIFGDSNPAFRPAVILGAVQAPHPDQRAPDSVICILPGRNVFLLLSEWTRRAKQPPTFPSVACARFQEWSDISVSSVHFAATLLRGTFSPNLCHLWLRRAARGAQS